MQRLTGQIQTYAWGSATALPKLLGVKASGEPQAEYWLGAHPSAPSSLEGRALNSLLDAQPGLIGEESVARFGPRLPYLLKLLAADRPLSLQVHPSRSQAEQGWAREEAEGLDRLDPTRNYRDGWPKPEAMVALEEFHGLCGFRDPQLSFGFFSRLGVLELAEHIEPLASPGGAVGIEEAFLSFLRMGPGETWLVDRVVDAARRHARDADQGFAGFCLTAVELSEHYPGDSGVLAALLCNRVVLRPGEALFLHAGLMHAYIRGVGVEIMANSDNVLRGGLTSKHVDVDELSKIVDFAPDEPAILPAPSGRPPVWRYDTAAPEFALWRLEPGTSGVDVPGEASARILVCVSGSLEATTDAGSLGLEQGQSLFMPAGDRVRLAGRGVGFLAGPGV